MLDQADAFDPGTTVASAIVGDRPEYEWAGDAKVRAVIAGLVSDLPWDAPVDTLSGGQRRRVALAALLTGEWDVLALDEPTNHLDVEGIAWLAGHLRTRWPQNAGGLLVVTHDRWFLDEVSTATWEVHDRLVEPFEGGYAAYILQRVERDRQNAVVEQKRQNLARKELAWLRRGAPARTSKPKFRIDAANELIADVPPLRDAVSLRSLATARLGKDVVDLLDAGVTFPGSSGAVGARIETDDRPVLHDVTWRIAPGERTGILGANGAGKSTLLGLVAGTLEPTAGRVKRGKTVRIGVLDQNSGILAPVEDDRVREVLARTRTTFLIDGKETTPAQLLERLGFPREHLSARISDLSGGQRRRLQLLLVLLEEPNVLILDEPTNDLDTDMLAALEDVLDSWPGTLIVVSHDRYFIERVTDQQYAILDGRLRHLPRGIDEYLELRAAAGRGLDTATSSPTRPAVPTPADAARPAVPAPADAARPAVPAPADAARPAVPAPAGDAARPATVLSGAERRTAEKEFSAVRAPDRARRRARHLEACRPRRARPVRLSGAVTTRRRAPCARGGVQGARRALARARGAPRPLGSAPPTAKSNEGPGVRDPHSCACPRRDSNPRPTAPEAAALSTELRRACGE